MWRRRHISANSFEDYGYPVRVSVVTYWPKMPEVIDFIIETSERLGLKLHTHHRLRTRPGIKAHTFLFERDEMPLRGFRPNATPESRHDERYFPNRYLLGSRLADELYRRTIHLSVDYAVTFGDLALYGPKLIVTDVDSTLITTEVIEMIAAAAGTKDRVREMTSSAMRGEVDFAQSLKDRVATLQGVPTDVFTRIAEEITFTDGALALINTAHRHGARFGVVSGGFHEVVDILARDAHIDYVLANRLEARDGVLTGKTLGPIIDADAKAHAMEQWAQELGVTRHEAVTVGDGANDLKMLDRAGLGVGFCGKDIVMKEAPAILRMQRLDAIAALVGWDIAR